jgi:translation initiation factor 3 subunit F
MDTLFLHTGSELVVKVHPVALFSILDAYLRKGKDKQRVMGSLLGRTSAGVVEITSCFPVVHNITEEAVAYGTDYNANMLELHERAHPDDELVGWFSTAVAGDDLVDQHVKVPIWDYYESICERPILLVVDALLREPTIGVRALVHKRNRLVNRAMFQFQEVKVVLEMGAIDRIAVDHMITGLKSDESSRLADTRDDLDVLEESLTKLAGSISSVRSYVAGVCEGKYQADPSTGRSIADALDAIPAVDADALKPLFESSLRDLLMVTYLSNLTHTQLAIAERITTKAQTSK